MGWICVWVMCARLLGLAIFTTSASALCLFTTQTSEDSYYTYSGAACSCSLTLPVLPGQPRSCVDCMLCTH